MPKSLAILAIDPGKSGGFAIHDSGGVRIMKMPATPLDIWDALLELSILSRCVCVNEKVGFHRQGNSASSSVKFAKNVAHIEMALLGVGIPTIYVTPNKWMTKVIGKVPKERTPRKNAIKAAMQALYPGLSITLDTADALGILTYALRERMDEIKALA